MSVGRCFVAMAFGQSDTDRLFDRVLRPILAAEDLVVTRIDRKEHNRNINDVILEELSSADLVLADLTYARPSVYFEAGFAERSVPVIYTARSDHFRARDIDEHGNLRVHFDVSMRNVISWRNVADKSFPGRLRRRVRYVLRPLLRARREAAARSRLEAEFRSLSLRVRDERLAAIARRLLSRAKFSLEKSKSVIVRGSRVRNGLFETVTLIPSQKVDKRLLHTMMILRLSAQSGVAPERGGKRVLRGSHQIVIVTDSPVRIGTIRSQFPSAHWNQNLNHLHWTEKDKGGASGKRKVVDEFFLNFVSGVRTEKDFATRFAGVLPNGPLKTDGALARPAA